MTLEGSPLRVLGNHNHQLVREPPVPTYTDIEKNLIQRAIARATGLHQDQFDKGGFPYIAHPMRVMSQVAAWEFDYEYIMAAILHDTVEDTDYSIEQACFEFSPRIGVILDAVTKRRGEKYPDFIDRIIATDDHGIIAIKLADINDNTQGWRVMGLSRSERDYLLGKYLQPRELLLQALPDPEAGLWPRIDRP